MAYKKITGIYLIQSISTPNRVYVGSGININKRWNRHRVLLRRNKHHSPLLQRHYNKYGEDDLVFEIIESGEYLCKQHLLSREQGWFWHYEYENTEKPYFNCEKIAGNRLGSKASEATRRKLSEQRKGKKLGPNGGGYKYTPEQSQRRSEQQMGAKNHQFGFSGTEETNRKKSLSHIGLKTPFEVLQHKKENYFLGLFIKEMDRKLNKEKQCEK